MRHVVCHSLKVCLAVAVPLAAVIAYADGVYAQQEASAPADKQRTVRVDDERVIASTLSERWTRVELSKEADDVIAIFRLSGGRKSQVDIRHAKLRSDGEIKTFLSSFYARIVERGFERVKRESMTISGREGMFSRYRYRKKEFRHRLEIWHWTTGSSVWMVTAFLADRQFDMYHRDVVEFVKEFELN